MVGFVMFELVKIGMYNAVWDEDERILRFEETEW